MRTPPVRSYDVQGCSASMKNREMAAFGAGGDRAAVCGQGGGPSMLCETAQLEGLCCWRNVTGLVDTQQTE